MNTQHDYRIRLTAGEERQLVAKMRAGDVEARNQLVESQVPWIMKLAAKFHSTSDVDDLISAGIVALIENCLPRFDPSRARLTTFAVRSVYWAMRDFDCKNVLITRPRNRQPKYANEWDAAGQTIEVGDSFVVAPPEPESDAAQAEIVRLLRAAIKELPDRQQDIIRSRMRGQTLLSIGNELGISKERVRQIEKMGHERLRQALGNIGRSKQAG